MRYYILAVCDQNVTMLSKSQFPDQFDVFASFWCKGQWKKTLFCTINWIRLDEKDLMIDNIVQKKSFPTVMMLHSIREKPHVRSLETVFVCNIGYKYTIKGKVIIFAIIPKD